MWRLIHYKVRLTYGPLPAVVQKLTSRKHSSFDYLKQVWGRSLLHTRASLAYLIDLQLDTLSYSKLSVLQHRGCHPGLLRKRLHTEKGQ